MASAWWKRRLEPERLRRLWVGTFLVAQRAAVGLSAEVEAGRVTYPEIERHEAAFRNTVVAMPPHLAELLAVGLLVGVAANGRR